MWLFTWMSRLPPFSLIAWTAFVQRFMMICCICVGSARINAESLKALTVMLIVVGVVARISFTVSLTILLKSKGFFSCSAFLLKVSICLTRSRPRKEDSMILAR